MDDDDQDPQHPDFQELFSEVHEHLEELGAVGTKMREVNEELARLYEKARDLQEIRTRFFTRISHDLRTPLMLILGQTRKLLETAAAGSDQLNRLRVIERNAQLLYRHGLDMFDVAQMDAGQMEMYYTRCDLAHFVRTIASYFEPLASDQNISFVVQTPQQLPAEFDIEKCKRVLLNLLSNAFKFTPAGGTITLALSEEEGNAHLTVQDSGPGIPEDLRQKVFDPYWQIDDCAHRCHGGAGLGLAIVKDFTELHHGSIQVEEAPGGGALFTVSVPLTAPAGATIHAEPQASDEIIGQQAVSELHTPRPPRTPTGAKDAPLVLIVEDNPDMNNYLAELLGRQYRAATAFDGQQGLQQALKMHPDLIVCDVLMPVMGGEEMVTELRKHPETAETPVLMVSARADETVRVRMLREGVQDFVTKPFSDDELLARVDGLIAERRRVGTRMQALKQEASTDFLTGLINRRHFFEMAEHELARSDRYGEQISVMLLDIDHFKQINDSYGHDVGDMVLKELSAQFQQSLRDIDIAARWGGEEFVILLPGTPGAKALKAAERLRAALSGARLTIDEKTALSFTVSIGTTVRSSEDDNISAIVKRADKALYAAKNAGRNCVRFEDTA